MATTYAYLVLLPATVLLASVNLVNSNHIGSYCLLAMTRSNTLNITVNHRLISLDATFHCCQMLTSCSGCHVSDIGIGTVFFGTYLKCIAFV